MPKRSYDMRADVKFWLSDEAIELLKATRQFTAATTQDTSALNAVVQEVLKRELGDKSEQFWGLLQGGASLYDGDRKVL